MDLNRTFIRELFEVNSFPYDETEPLIVVFRNTNPNGIFMSDIGQNNCDLVSLFTDEDIVIGRGRSITHQRYQKKMVSGEARANRIASSYTGKAWRKGSHISRGRPFPALIQNVKFIVWRSSDMVLGNADDYNETGIFSDNFHGWAPLSAGCVTVEGNMANPWQKSNGDWLRFVTKIYESDHTFYNAAIMEFDDWLLRRRLRPGSQGELVAQWQRKLGIKEDGDFGPVMMDAVRKFQSQHGVPDNGILDLEGL